MFYFFFAYKQLKKANKEIIFSVPSGNFGNICAGIMAYKLGLPVQHFIASTNINDTVPRYLINALYEPKPSKQTISNAMDVGNPSNFIRIQKLFNDDFENLKSMFSSISYTDEETKKAILKIIKTSGYVTDPHGAVGYLGLKDHLKEDSNQIGVFLETAHPVKFLDVVESTLPTKIDIPQQIESVLDKNKVCIEVQSYSDLKSYLLTRI
jgi:threonine synthase